MFYHVARGRHSDTEGRDSRTGRSDGRTSRVDSDDGRHSGTKRSRTPSTQRGGHFEDGDHEEGSAFDEAEEEEELCEYMYVPQSMLGRPLKDFDSGQENVSNLAISLCFSWVLIIHIEERSVPLTFLYQKLDYLKTC